MDDIINVARTEALNDDYENFRLNFAKTLEYVKVFPWTLDVKAMKFNNIFGTDILLSKNHLNADLKEWIQIIHPDDKSKVSPLLNNILEGTIDELSIDYRVKKTSTDYMWVKTIAKIRKKDDSGKPLIIAGINQDITRGKLLEMQTLKKEKKIRESESRLRNVMKIGRMSIWEYNYEFETMTTDRKMAKVWGLDDYYERGEAVRTDVLAGVIHPEDRDNVLERFRHSVEKNESFEMCFRIVVKGDVKYINYVGEVIFNDDGKPVILLGVTQDITKMKSLEDSLARQYDGLRFISEKAGLGLWEFNTRENSIFIITRDDKKTEPDSIYRRISMEDFNRIIHHEDFEMFQSKVNSHVYKEGDVIDFDIRINTENETYRWFHITAVVDKIDEYGNPAECKGLYQDITERKEIEERLYQSQKMEAIGRLAGGIAHDFNNLLQVILGYGSLALMDAENNSDMLENITHIVDSGEKAKSLVRQLLLFARREKFRPSPVALNDLISGFIKMMKRVIGENITLTFNPDAEIQYIHGDIGQLEQVFMNLCINARDALGGSGSIIITTRNITVDEYWPCYGSSISPGTYVMLSLSDTGYGIPAENINHIFEPFFTTKDKNMGTGLGLATVYSIVNQHNSYIDVHSITGKGTTFSIYFPVYGAAIPVFPQMEKEKAEQRYSGNETVLLAEDDDLIRKYTERILRDSGYNVITAEDGEMALNLFNKNSDKIDLLVFDVVMPKKNGWDVYSEIREKRRNIPVLFFSGYDQNLLPMNAMDTFPMAYVQKPFKYYSVIKAVNELLDRKKT